MRSFGDLSDLPRLMSAWSSPVKKDGKRAEMNGGSSRSLARPCLIRTLASDVTALARHAAAVGFF